MDWGFFYKFCRWCALTEKSGGAKTKATKKLRWKTE